MAYQELKSYRQATIIYDFTVEFCKRYVSARSRTVDQMVQAARSGKQNIVEGSAVSQTWPATELKLVGVARGSLEELLEDYKDFLRQRSLAMWAKEDPRSQALRALAHAPADAADRTNKTDKADTSYKSYSSYKPYGSYASHQSYSSYQSYASYLHDPEQAANAMITLINQTNFLLDQQMKSIRAQMEAKGVSNETHNQKLKRIMAKSKKENDAFDAEMREIVEKAKKSRESQGK